MLDTNVLVSALLRPESPPARVLDLVMAREVGLVLDGRIFAEYAEVLERPKFRLDRDRSRDLVESIWQSSERVEAAALSIVLPDPDDLMFIEVAVSGLADALVTGNLRHFPAPQRHGVHVASPVEWLAEWLGLKEG